MRTHLLVPVGAVLLLLVTACEDKVTDEYLARYEAPYAVLCVPGISTSDNRRGIMALCQYAGGGAQVACPSNGASLGSTATLIFTATELRYSAYVASWDRCWELADNCIERRECPDGVTLGPAEVRVSREGVVFQ